MMPEKVYGLWDDGWGKWYLRDLDQTIVHSPWRQVMVAHLERIGDLVWLGCPGKRLTVEIIGSDGLPEREPTFSIDRGDDGD